MIDAVGDDGANHNGVSQTACKRGTGVFLPKTSKRPFRGNSSGVMVPQQTLSAGAGSSSTHDLPRNSLAGVDLAVTPDSGCAFPDPVRYPLAPSQRSAATSSDSMPLRAPPAPPPAPPAAAAAGSTLSSRLVSSLTSYGTASITQRNCPFSEPGVLPCSHVALKPLPPPQGLAPLRCESPLRAWLSNNAAGPAGGNSPCGLEHVTHHLPGAPCGNVVAEGAVVAPDSDFDGFSAEHAAAADDGSSLAAAAGGELGGWVMRRPRAQLPCTRSGSGSGGSSVAWGISSNSLRPVVISADGDVCNPPAWTSPRLLAAQQHPADCAAAAAACRGGYITVSASSNVAGPATCHDDEGSFPCMPRRSVGGKQQQLVLDSTAGGGPCQYLQSWDSSSLAGAGPLAASPTLVAVRAGPAAGHVFSAGQAADVVEGDAYLVEGVGGPHQQQVTAVTATAHPCLGQQPQLQLLPAAVGYSSGSSSSSSSILMSSIVQRQEELVAAIDNELYHLLQLREQVLASEGTVTTGCSNTSYMAVAAAGPALLPTSLEPPPVAWPYSNGAPLPAIAGFGAQCSQEPVISSCGNCHSMNLNISLSAPAASSLAPDYLQLALAADAGMLPAGVRDAGPPASTGWKAQRPCAAVSDEVIQLPGRTAAAAAGAWGSGESVQQLQRKAAIRAAASGKIEQLAAIQAMQKELAEQLLQLRR